MKIAFCASKVLYDLDFYKDILRKTARKYDNVLLRIPKSLTGDAAELTHFAEALGWTIEKWAIHPAREKYGSDVRNKEMLHGTIYDPTRLSKQFRDPVTDWPFPAEVRGQADLSLFFIGVSGKDTAADIAKAAEKIGGTLPLHIYREKWTKKRGFDPVFRHIAYVTRDENWPIRLGSERVIHTPDQERQAA